ncbi:MAG: type II secretion system protein GspG [Polyangiales bacterium]
MRARRRLEGLTLVELMAVLVIIALVATGAGVMIFKQVEKARIKATKTDVQQVRGAAMTYLLDQPGAQCPTVDVLVKEGELDANKKTQDAWNNDFQIQCEGTDVRVTSAGPDGKMGTEDDIS